MSFMNKHLFMICSGHINILEGKLGMALAHKILQLMQTKRYLISTKVKALNPVKLRYCFEGNVYSQLSLDRHLYKTDTSVKRTPRVGPCLSLLPLVHSL